MQAGLCRMRTESLVAPSPPAGKRFLDARDERPQTAPASNAAPTAWNAGSHPHRASALHPVQETAIIPVCSGLIRGTPANLGHLRSAGPLKRFADLTEQEILALAITNEDEDSR